MNRRHQSRTHLAKTLFALFMAWSLMIAPLAPLVGSASPTAPVQSMTDKVSPLANLFVQAQELSGLSWMSPQNLMGLASDLYNSLLAAQTASAALPAPGGVDTDLALWLKADAGVAGGPTVTQWNDQSGGGLNATAVSTPLLDPADINFNPSISFDGSTDKFNLTSPLGTGNVPADIFAVSYTSRIDHGGEDFILFLAILVFLVPTGIWPTTTLAPTTI